MPFSTDVIVIGGGVIGCSLAYHLRKRGVAVLVCEQGEIGGQASSAATGSLAPLKPFAKPDDPYTRLLLASFALFPTLIPELEEYSGITVELERTGTLRVIRPQQMTRMQHWIATWRQAGFRLELLTGSDLRTYEPLLAPTIGAALFLPEEMQVRAAQLVRAYALAATRLGAILFPHAEVVGIQHHGTRVTGVLTTQGEHIDCTHLILAAGAWAGRCADWLGVRLPICPLKGQSLSILQPIPALRHTVFGEGIYLAPKGDGTVIVGATREDTGFDASTTAEGTAWLSEALTRLLPTWDGRVKHTWAGLRPKTPDARPLLGSVPAWENVTLATGHNEFGILLSALTGQIVAERIATGATSYDLRPFALDRFLIADR